MPTVTNHLVPYCLMLPKLGRALFPVSQRELAPMALFFSSPVLELKSSKNRPL